MSKKDKEQKPKQKLDKNGKPKEKFMERKVPIKEEKFDSAKAIAKKHRIELDLKDASDFQKRQQKFFDTHVSFAIQWREEAVSCLSQNTQRREEELVEAISKDLNIGAYEAALTEIIPVHQEFRTINRNIRRWTRTKRQTTIDKSSIFKGVNFKAIWQPIGSVCIINASNSPFTELMLPVIDAIGAGCTVTLKNPSRFENTNKVIETLIDETYAQEAHIKFIVGDDEVDMSLAQAGYDLVYYVGPNQKKEAIMKVATLAGSEVAMQLYGNNPVIVENSANIRTCTKRIMWGKMLQAGQMRLAPDWVCAQDKAVEPLVNTMGEYIDVVYGENPLESDNCPTMPNKELFDKACQIIDSVSNRDEIVWGGGRDAATLRIEPTIIFLGSINSPILKMDLVGPIIPIVAYEHLKETIDGIRALGDTPALYLFTANHLTSKNYYVENISFGSACVNDIMIQGMNRTLPSAAAGKNGAGHLGGEIGILTFGFFKAVADGRTKGEFADFRFPPFNNDYKKMTMKFKGMK